MKVFEDFDKYHPIPRELGKYNYIYAAGCTKDEVMRYFILPREDYERYKEKAKADFRLCFMNDDVYFSFKRTDYVNKIAPLENSYGYKLLLLTSCTSSNPDNRNCELRNKRKILKQFTTPELDIIEEETTKMNCTKSTKNYDNEVEDDADDTPHS